MSAVLAEVTSVRDTTPQGPELGQLLARPLLGMLPGLRPLWERLASRIPLSGGWGQPTKLYPERGLLLFEHPGHERRGGERDTDQVYLLSTGEVLQVSRDNRWSLERGFSFSADARPYPLTVYLGMIGIYDAESQEEELFVYLEGLARLSERARYEGGLSFEERARGAAVVERAAQELLALLPDLRALAEVQAATDAREEA